MFNDLLKKGFLVGCVIIGGICGYSTGEDISDSIGKAKESFDKCRAEVKQRREAENKS